MAITPYLSLDFIIQELFLELSESVVATVVVQVERIQHISGGGRLEVIIKSQDTNWVCHRTFCLTPSWRAPWSPGCGPWGSRAWTSQWGTGFDDPWSAPGRTLWTTAGTGHSTAAGPLDSGRTQAESRKWKEFKCLQIYGHCRLRTHQIVFRAASTWFF